MKKLLIIPAMLFLTVLSSFTKTSVPATPKNSGPIVITGNHFYDMTGFTMDYPCPPNPETVVYNGGQLHENYTLIIHENGMWNFSSHLNAQNCSGTGQNSGNNYQLPGSQSFTFSGNPDTGEFFVYYSRYKFRLISQGNTANAEVIIIIKHIFNRNGEEVSTEVSTETTCI